MYWMLENSIVNYGIIATQAEAKQCLDIAKTSLAGDWTLTQLDSFLHIDGTWTDESHDYESFTKKYGV